MGGKIIYEALLRRVREEYDVEKTLKSGDRGVILLIRHKQTKTRYVFRSFSGVGEAYRKLLDVSCPHLPKIEDTAEKDGQVAVLEEYIQGDTLAYLLEGPPLSEDQAKDIAIQVSRALAVLHSLGIVHRDIKPENILLRGSEAVVIDFDASRISKPENTSDTRIMGTTGYAAPEQYGFSQTDARADIYALGVLMNEMLTKQHPASRLADGCLRPVIERCIEVNVDKRFSSAEELIAALGASETRKIKRPGRFIFPALALLIGASAAFLWFRAKQPVSTVLSSENNTSNTWLLNAPIPKWRGPATTMHTDFTYDLDGDGEEEDYVFGFASDLEHSYVGLSGIDSRTPIPGSPSQCIVAPGVGSYISPRDTEPVPEFGSLLENITFTLYCVEQQGTSEPQVWSIDNLNGIWPGTVCILFEAEDAGTWIYEYTAELNGKTLTARGISNVRVVTASGEVP